MLNDFLRSQLIMYIDLKVVIYRKRSELLTYVYNEALIENAY